MPRVWRIRSAEAHLVEDLATRLDVSPLFARCLFHRELRTEAAARAYLRPALTDLHDPFLFRDMRRAVERITAAVRAGEPILVHGDYDADGILGTAILLLFLRLAGASPVYHIPDRVKEGYSFQESALERIEREGIRLVLTVDNGSGAGAALDRLRERGVDVVVTDHHPSKGEPVRATAVLNPNLPGEAYPFPSLCGAGVAFKLAWAVAEGFTPARKGSIDFQTFLQEALGLVAIATIADLAPMVGENRALVRFGLAALSRTTLPGLRVLLETAHLEGCIPAAQDVALRVAPKVNAAGRLGAHDVAIECLTTPSRAAAEKAAARLERLNVERRRIDREVAADARRRVREEIDLAKEGAILLASPEWHPGVVGLAAMRIAAEHRRPTALVAMRDGKGRGSIRGPRGTPVAPLLEACADLLEDWGGHEFAGGFVVRADRLEALRARLSDAARAAQTREVEVLLDAEVPLAALTPPLLDELRALQPHGTGNEEPLFAARSVEVVEATRPPRAEAALLVREGGALHRVSVPAWLLDDEPIFAGDRIALAYSPPHSSARRSSIRVRELGRDVVIAAPA
jgi:single-stranded-DNA-specific exonuclease